MTNLQYAKLNAYNDISGVFDTYKIDLEMIPSMPETAQYFQSLHEGLNNLVMHTGEDLKTNSVTRKMKRATLLQKLLPVCHAIEVIKQTKNQNIPATVSLISESWLKQKKDIELHAYAIQIIKDAQPIEKQMVSAFINLSAITDLQKASEEFIDFIQISKEANHKKKSLNQQISNQIKELDLYLKSRVDILMLFFKQDNPIIYHAYKEARKFKNKTYSARALFNDIILANTTQTIADISNQTHNWLLIKNNGDTILSIFLSMIKDIALGEGIAVPAQCTIYRQVRNLHPDTRARYLIAKNDDKKDNGFLEIWMG